MTDEQKAAYIIAQAVSAFADIVAAQAANHQRIEQGYALAYDEAAISQIPQNYHLHTNRIIDFFKELKQ